MKTGMVEALLWAGLLVISLAAGVACSAVDIGSSGTTAAAAGGIGSTD